MVGEPLSAPVETSSEEVEIAFRIATDLLTALQVAAFQRRSLGEEDFRLPQLLHEALCQWLDRQTDHTTSVPVRVGTEPHD